SCIGELGSFSLLWICCTAPLCQAESYSAKTVPVSNSLSSSDSSLVWLVAVEYFETRSAHCCRPFCDSGEHRLPAHLPSAPFFAKEPPAPYTKEPAWYQFLPGALYATKFGSDAL